MTTVLAAFSHTAIDVVLHIGNTIGHAVSWNRLRSVLAIVALLAAPLSCSPSVEKETPASQPPLSEQPADVLKGKYSGSMSCKPCHEKFYQLWETSFHGTAMQPYTAQFAKQSLRYENSIIRIGEFEYQVSSDGFVIERKGSEKRKYPITQVMGGKNVFYFLTPYKRGRLQVLPIGYDVRTYEWFDVAKSGVRHMTGPDGFSPSSPLHWKDPEYTFNTSCFRCHVSQLSKNYNQVNDSYHTEWREPGINCETCHGPSDEHVKVCAGAQAGQVPRDLKIVRGGRSFSAQQNNDNCSVCHALMVPLTDSFMPGDSFFDHFDLVTLENEDFYPDGREKGETYTFTTFLQSGCVASGKLDCLHCHTSSGRFRMREQPNSACMPCHRQQVESIAKHSHHPITSKSPGCIDCHMPATFFARMKRSDHSMRPPVPAATIAFGSDNACTLCHKNQTAKWADQQVTSWHGDSRKAKVLHQGALIAAARARKWDQLPAMIKLLDDEATDDITKASLLRLLANCEDNRVTEPILKQMKSPSPLVRSSAAAAGRHRNDSRTRSALLSLTRDPVKAVRIRAAESLSLVPLEAVSSGEQDGLHKATREYVESLQARADDALAQQRLGNFYLDRRQFKEALAAFTQASKLRPDSFEIWNNLALAQYAASDQVAAQISFEKALELNPNSEAVHLNLGMLLAERKQIAAARIHFLAILQLNPQAAAAAYNLCVLDASSNWSNARGMCERAMQLDPGNISYAYAFAFYLRGNGEGDKAISILESMAKGNQPPDHVVRLLQDLLQQRRQGTSTWKQGEGTLR